MARRLCFEERVRIEAMAQGGVGAAEAARRLGRHPVTVQRELGRNKGPGGYDAGAAQAGSCARAARPKAPKLAEDAELAAAVCERLAMRWSPPPISADLGALGLRVCSETIYRACYDRHSRRGLAERSWTHLPRQHRRRKPRGRTEQAKRSALGEFRPLAERPGESRHQSRARTLGGRPDHRQSQPHRSGHPGRKNQPPHPGGAVARRLQRPRHSPGRHSRAGPPARPHGQNPDLGPRTRDGPLGPHRKKPRHRGVLLRTPIPLATTCQRANQRPAATLAPQKHRPQHRPGTPRHHRRPPQHHAPTHPQLELSPNHLHCPQLQPPIELAPSPD